MCKFYNDLLLKIVENKDLPKSSYISILNILYLVSN